MVKWLGSRLFAIRHETQETRIAIDSQEHDNINLALENVEKEKEALLQEGSARSQPLQTIPSRQVSFRHLPLLHCVHKGAKNQVH